MPDNTEIAEDLAACPFCGGAAQEAHMSGGGHVFFSVECSSCNAVVSESDPQRAVMLWNRRTPTTPKPAADAGELDRLEALLAKATETRSLSKQADAQAEPFRLAALFNRISGPVSFPAAEEAQQKAVQAMREIERAAVAAMPALIASARATAHLAGENEALRREHEKEQYESSVAWREAFDGVSRRANDVEARAIAAERERDAAVALLQPFAEAADNLDDKHGDGSPIWEAPAAMSIDAGHLREAARFLATLTEGNSHAG